MFGLRGIPAGRLFRGGGGFSSSNNDEEAHGTPEMTPPFVWWAIAAVSMLGAFLVFRLMEPVAERLRKRGLCGRDINKPKTKQPIVPESTGILPGVVYILCAVLLQPRLTIGTSVLLDAGGATGRDWLAMSYFDAALVAIVLSLLCGFLDDVLDLRWSQKIGLSFVAVTPLLVAYAGPTWVVVPKPFRHSSLIHALVSVGDPQDSTQSVQDVQDALANGIVLVDLGLLYLLYMLLFAVFCTNSININAGINGLEVGQSIVIALAFLVHCVFQALENPSADPSSTVLPIALLVPFITTSAALLWFNWYPSRVFVGDSYTYWAGMTLGVVGIVSHSTKTLMLFFLPQLINFAYSVPQIIGVFGPCPRHRMPRFNSRTNKLECVPQNHNLINLILWVFGPMHERTLCVLTLLFQVLCCFIAFVIRYKLAAFFYD